ncbi:MAG: type II toxin-antitoxin system PemK/MazF family toxin [Symploca sp. SIO2D2]|nr:type II toxin-antitoxin system PemK/MazF family toxin [Symploca sp. SIO2D2]NER20742.1 type II toxin-antitoxin system PemK/MazF family toxin [Symploca sp. SIO1C2]NER48383.1 type II toxin-antitoxin system PemK/MazF family toxin [Symploca sp. SIO1A3]
MNPKPGEVWLADLGLVAKTRPVVVVSRYDPDPPRSLVIYVPLTKQNRESRYEVELPKLRFLNQKSFANVQGLGSIPQVRLERKLGDLPPEVIYQIRQAILFALDLDTNT